MAGSTSLFKTAFSTALRLKYPIVQAPCAGHTSVELVAAVSNAGGLGSLGAAMMPLESMRSAIRAIKERTTQPFAVNLFARPEPTPTTQELQQLYLPTDEVLDAIRAELNIPKPTTFTLRSPPLNEQISILLEERVPVVSFTFGLLPDNELERLSKAGTYVIGTATSVQEAVMLAQRNVDAIVAQGVEAGGHQGTFMEITERLPTGELVQRIREALHNSVKVQPPVLAAGGLSTGADVAKALKTWQADGVVMGTLFMMATESSTPAAHRRVLLEESSSRQTRFTRGLTGRLARGFTNQFMERMDKVADQVPRYDIHSAKTKDIVAYATQNGLPEYMLLWSGANASVAADYSERGTLTAAQLIAKIVSDVQENV